MCESDMKINEIIKEIDKLNMSEKLLLVKDIWDGIAESNAKLPISELQKEELDRRYHEYKCGKIKLHDWKDVHQKIRGE